MTVLPIVGRELRVAARGRAIYWVRLGIGLLAILIAAGIFVFTFGLTPEQIGRRMFEGLAGLIFLYCLAYGRRSTADCLSQEKREGTLGLLFLTDLKGHDVVLGKLAATSLRGFYGLLAVFPVLAVPLLLGGVTNGEFWRMVLVLVDTFLFSLAIGMLGSALSREFRRAMAANFILLLLLLGGLPAFAAAIAYFDPLHPLVRELFFACPVYAFYLCADATFSLSPTQFWWCVGTVHVLTWLLIALASSIAPRSWQDQPDRARPRGWREFWRRWSYGNSAKQKEFRRGALDMNAFYWLAARARLKPVHVWTFLGFMLGWWLVGWATSGHLWLDPTVAILTTLMLNGALKVWVAIESGQELAEDQKTGAFELLLSSSLTVKDILRGQLLALRRQFFWPLLAVIAVELLFMRALHRRSLEPYPLTWLAGLFILVADICALSWVGMRNALTARSHNHATISTTLRVLMLPWALFGAVVGGGTLWYGLSLDQDWSPGGKFYVGLWFGLSLVVDLTLGFIAWRQLNTQFRQLALRRLNPRSESASGTEPSAGTKRSATPNALVRTDGKFETESSPSSAVAGTRWRDKPQPSPPGEGEGPPVARSKEPGLLVRTPDASADSVAAISKSRDGKYGFRLFSRPAVLVLFILLAASIALVSWKSRAPRSPALVVSMTRSNAPVRVFPGGSGALIILPDGSLWRWGHPGLFGSSQVGDHQRVGTNSDWVQASGIYGRSFGLRSDGTLWEWDSRNQGAGDAQAPFSISPDRDSGQTRWIAVEAGSATSTALRRDGTIWSWTNSLMSQTGSKSILTQVGTNDDWVAICGRWSCALGLKRDGTLWAWGMMPIVGSGQAPVNLTFPAKLCRETNWAGFDMGFFPLVRTRSGEVWEPFHGSPDADASVASVCRLLLTNSGPGRVATAICGRPMLYQIRANGTLWETTYDFGAASTAGRTWRRVDKRSDWVSLYAGAGAAFGSTSDGVLWTWGYDFSRQAKPSVGTRFKQIQLAIQSRFGSAPLARQMGSMPPYNEQPKPFLRLVFTNALSGADH